jgi:predicted GH43/DUF377 family glycosyl hydrolase
MSDVATAAPGRIFLPGPEGWWDSERVSSPQVLRLPSGEWRMWYYGRDASFDREVNLPSGRSGMARSADGIRWERVRGPLTRGACLEPSPDAGRFDSNHVGITDVRFEDGLFWTAFLGGDDRVVFRGDVMRKGLRMRPGMAVSRDGLHWFKLGGPFAGAVLDVGAADDWDSLFVSWPKVVRLDDDRWLLHYHTLDNRTRIFRIGLATSIDGLHFTKLGPVLDHGGPGSADERGHACRHILRISSQWVMFFEMMNLHGQASIGVATSADGLKWEKEPQPVLQNGRPGEWDSHAVGLPCVVPMDDGSFRMYYVGANETGLDDELSRRHAIGLAVSDGPDFRRWMRWQAPPG